MALAVVDTNILVSALLRPDGPPGVVLRDIVRQRLTPVVCEAIMAEYAGVLARRRFGFDPDDVRELLTLLGQQAAWVEIPPHPDIPGLPDPADWPFIACALVAGCPVVTGNAKHFPEAAGMRIMSAREWVERA